MYGYYAVTMSALYKVLGSFKLEFYKKLISTVLSYYN